MSITITWGTRVINVPKSDLTLLQSNPVEIRELDLDWFRLQLKDLEDDEEGIPHPDTHRHNVEVQIGGLTLARVIEIINGYTITFEDDQYAVNLVGANSNVGDVINVNQVSVRSFNSAGLISSAAIEYSSFNGGVTIDVINGTAGTVGSSTNPVGTPRNPSNNTTDALLIAYNRGFNVFYIIGDIELDSGTDFNEMIFVGESKTKTVINILDDADVENCEFLDAEVTGILDGGNVLKDCLIGNINYINGYIEQCVLKSGTIVLGGNEEAHFLDCWSGVVGSSTPIIDMGGSGQGLGLRNYNGGIKIINKTGSEKIIIDLNSGQVVLDSTVTNGEVIVRGIGKLTDNSTGTTVVDSLSLISQELMSHAVWQEVMANQDVAGSFGEGVKNILGLSQENQYMDTCVYDGDNNLTSARIRLYNNAANTDIHGVTGLLATYIVTVTWLNGVVQTYKVTKQ